MHLSHQYQQDAVTQLIHRRTQITRMLMHMFERQQLTEAEQAQVQHWIETKLRLAQAELFEGYKWLEMLLGSVSHLLGAVTKDSHTPEKMYFLLSHAKQELTRLLQKRRRTDPV